jgi:hypothetical protein
MQVAPPLYTTPISTHFLHQFLSQHKYLMHYKLFDTLVIELSLLALTLYNSNSKHHNHVTANLR